MMSKELLRGLEIPKLEKNDFFKPAIISLSLLIAGTLLYPDTFSSLSLKYGPIRISMMLVLFLLTAPMIVIFISQSTGMLRLRLVDYFLIGSIVYITFRGLAASSNANVTGLTLANACYVILLYYGAATIFQRDGAPHVFFNVIVMITLFIGLYAILEFILKENILYGSIISEKVPIPPSRSVHRSGSTLGHPDALGIFTIQSIPFLVYYFIKLKSFWKMAACGAITIIATIALEFSFTRASWITLAVVAIFTFILLIHRRKVLKKYLILLTIVAVSLTFVTIAIRHDVLAGTLSKQRNNESIGTRETVWAKVPKLFVDHPFFGVGMWQSYRYVTDAGHLAINKLASIDNYYLSTLVEEGLVGVVLLGGTIFLIFRDVWKVIRGNLENLAAAVCVGVSMAAVMINGVTANVLLIWPVLVFFWSSAGLIRAWNEMQFRGTLGKSLD